MLFVKAFDKDRKYRIGFDIREDCCQVSYCERGGEIFTFSQKEEAEEYNIPTLLFKKAGVDEWFFGQAAKERAGDPDGTLIANLPEAAIADQPIEIEGRNYDAVKLLGLFLDRCFKMLARAVPSDRIGAVMFTLKTVDERVVNLFEKIKPTLPVPEEVVSIEEHDSSFYHYMLFQEEELRQKDVLLLEYKGQDRLLLSRLTYNRRTSPIVSVVKNSEYVGLPYTSPLDMDMQLTKILQQELAAGNYSSAHLIGEGFDGQWMRDSLKLLCRNCRVFQGNNLYSKGACASACCKTDAPDAVEHYFFLNDHKLQANIGIKATSRGDEGYYPLLDAGVNWYEAKREEDFILEGTGELQLIMMPLTGGKASEYTIRLDELPVREDRLTRVRLSLSLESEHQLLIRIRDMGFGEIFPSSNLRWEKGIAL